jgi:cytochrome c oxidase subunit IV
MPEHSISPTTYTLVCLILVLLTALTMSVSFLPVAGVWHIVIGLAIGLIKASLVVLFFMHLLLSDRVTWLVVAIACFWLGILLVLTLTDYFSRGSVPYMPGH